MPTADEMQGTLQHGKDAMPAGPIPERFHDLLASTAFAFVATLGPGGAPQVNPVWFLWDGEHILLSLIESKRKFRNLQRDARVAVAIAHPSDPYRYLEVRGRVGRLDPDIENRVFDAISRKYTGDAYSLEPPDTVRYVARVEVERYTFQEDVVPPQAGPDTAESPARAPDGGV
jgi:PPOX class probable F420-dependent enzyme